VTYANPDALVETDWLAAHLYDTDVKVLDASYHLPGTGRDPETEFADRHIPGAMLFDIEDVRNRDIPLPHMLPSAEQFAAQMCTLGINDGDMVVIYDVHGVQTAPRAWWTFRAFGYDKVAVLNGGLPKWLAENRPVTDDIVDREKGRFTARADAALIRSVEQILANQETRAELVVDARPPGRFDGVAPEPREGLRPGHIPGSVNLPAPRFVDPTTKTVLPADAIRAALTEAGIDDPSRPMVTSCGSGVSACVLSLGLGHHFLKIVGNDTSHLLSRIWVLLILKRTNVDLFSVVRLMGAAFSSHYLRGRLHNCGMTRRIWRNFKIEMGAGRCNGGISCLWFKRFQSGNYLIDCLAKCKLLISHAFLPSPAIGAF